ncbi:hypothetical protein AtNW77_Chr4g0304331 [Arabidopsis thaliana]
MERNVEKMLNRVSVVFLSIGTMLMHLPLPKKNARIWFSGAWKSRLSSFSTYFP